MSDGSERDCYEHGLFTTHCSACVDAARAAGAADAEARLAPLIKQMRDALRLAHVQLEDITGWSGSSGNWPLQDAELAVRKAIECGEHIKEQG